MNQKSELLSVINHILLSKGKAEMSSINSQMNLKNDLGFDSFDLAELTVRIEDIFNIDVFSNGVVNTIGEIEILLSN